MACLIILAFNEGVLSETDVASPEAWGERDEAEMRIVWNISLRIVTKIRRRYFNEIDTISKKDGSNSF